jgi:hypothetical protein
MSHLKIDDDDDDDDDDDVLGYDMMRKRAVFQRFGSWCS